MGEFESNMRYAKSVGADVRKPQRDMRTTSQRVTDEVKMDCLKIVKNYLISNGFDGLQAEAECGCEIDDLVPCGNDFSQCTPGYKVSPPDDGDFDFYICGSKKDRPWE